MRSRYFVALPIVLALCAITAVAVENHMSRDDLVREFQKLIPPGTTTDGQVVDTNGFHIESSRNKELGGDFKPDGNEFQMIQVRAEGAFRVVVEKGRPSSGGGGLAIFHRDSGEPILSVGDSNGDGQLDGLTYSKVDAAGKILVTVMDYDMDGQPDLRINFADHYVEIWHVDRWYRVEKRDDHRGVVINGSFVELRHENNRYYVP